ncbi:DUF1850 domain-containing protein [Noviherbaspirillum sp.]|uniref:DUF1850 domain-containing protein n=1 Tax=Noviherbaspirillum sp. TaxID=1926288 RepID=UPI0025E55BA5|nr:DUF1850 domain-containing protein [Noviherbaspirillum sp.]
MSGLCLAAAALSVALPLQSFTLAWTHSIEKIRWEEDYRIVDQRLQLVEARVRGHGAGMEPPEGAVLKDGVWHYRPALPPLPRVQLARSSYVADYEMCWDGLCRPMKDIAGPVEKVPVVELFPCDTP